MMNENSWLSSRVKSFVMNSSIKIMNVTGVVSVSRNAVMKSVILLALLERVFLLSISRLGSNAFMAIIIMAVHETNLM